jgi:hypothetical protein
VLVGQRNQDLDLVRQENHDFGSRLVRALSTVRPSIAKKKPGFYCFAARTWRIPSSRERERPIRTRPAQARSREKIQLLSSTETITKSTPVPRRFDKSRTGTHTSRLAARTCTLLSPRRHRPLLQFCSIPRGRRRLYHLGKHFL